MRLVQKFGGTSMADVARIRASARLVKEEVNAGNQVAVVVSAMAGSTDRLVKWTQQMAHDRDAREYDVVVSAGEQITIGLMALALQSLGVRARSWLGWQVPVRTDAAHGRARIRAIEATAIDACLADGQVAVHRRIFRGWVPDGRITTLGRGRLGYLRGGPGGRVARRALRHFHRCRGHLYDRSAHRGQSAQARPGDVRGNARNGLPGRQGAGDPLGRDGDEPTVSSCRCVRVSPTGPELWSSTRGEELEHEVVRGIAYTRDEAKVTMVGVPDRPGVAGRHLRPAGRSRHQCRPDRTEHPPPTAARRI